MIGIRGKMSILSSFIIFNVLSNGGSYSKLCRFLSTIIYVSPETELGRRQEKNSTTIKFKFSRITNKLAIFCVIENIVINIVNLVKK